MKKTILLGGLAALALATAGGVAVAQQTAPAPVPHNARGDADGDGRISQAEFVGQRITRLSTADANRDGSVTADEMQAQRQAHRAERQAAQFDRLDADDNGSISRAEFDARPAMRAEGGPNARGPGAGRGGPRPERAARMERRMEARGPVVIAEAQTKAGEQFARLDTDRDGYVTAAERQAQRMERGERRQERRMNRQASPAAPVSE